MVGAELSRADFAFVVEDGALTLTLIVAPLTIVDITFGVEELAAATGAFALNIFTDIDISGGAVNKSALTVATILLPCAFKNVTIELKQFALTFTCEALVLTVVDVTVRVKKLTNGFANAEVKDSFENLAVVQKDARLTVELVVLEASDEDVAVSHAHLAILAHATLPLTAVAGTVGPSHLATAFALSGFPFTLVSSFLVFGACHPRNTVQVLHAALAAWSAILKVTFELVSVFVVNNPLEIELSISKRSSLRSTFLILSFCSSRG